MILAAGLTPAWQQILCLDRLRPGEVNRAVDAHWCASGKVINVGMALAALGCETHILAPVGGWSGKSIEQELSARDLGGSWIMTETPTRVCTTLLDAATGLTTELVQNALPLSAADLSLCSAAYRAAAQLASMVVISGSLPPGTPSTLPRDWLAATPCPAVLDVRGPELLACLAARPRVVKPNREELAATVGRPLPDRDAAFAAMQELLERGAQAVVVTHGKEEVLAAEGSQRWELAPPAVGPVVNPIGSGDCLAAGLAAGLAQGRSFLDAVKLGIAAAVDNVTRLLPAQLDRDRLPHWESAITVRRIM